MNDRYGVIFDLDGTLADTLPDLTDAVNYGLRALSLPSRPAEDVRTWIGEGLPVLCQRALMSAGSRMPPDRLVPLVSGYYTQHRLDKSGPFPGIPELLDELTARQIPICVLSNKPHIHTAPIVKAMFPKWTFAAIEGYREELRKKPDPRTALEIVATLGLPADRVMLVGDSATDMKTAVNAGIIPVGATWGYRPREELLASGAQHLIDTPGELLKLV